MRAFVAIHVAPAARAALCGLQAGLPVGRAVPEENLHLTLAFLGERPEAEVHAAHEALSELRAPGFDLALAGVECLGGGAAQVVCAGVRPEPALGALQKAVRRALHAAGLPLPRARFRPHVTIARLRTPPGPEESARLARFLAAAAGFAAPPFRVSEFGLYRSTLGRGTARHDLLAAYPLGD